MKHLKFFLFTFFCAYLMAQLEVQIEGAGGWAANLPTWRREIHFPLMGMWGKYAKPLTGYHFYLWLFTFTLPHFVFLFSKWSLKKELKLISFYVFFSTIEGLLWFAINPNFGWRRFESGKIPWYKEAWVLGLPAEYWLRFGVGSVIYWISNVGKEDSALKLPEFHKKAI